MNLVLAQKSHSVRAQKLSGIALGALHYTPRVARGVGRAIATATLGGRKITRLQNAANRLRHSYHLRRQARTRGARLVDYRRSRDSGRTFDEQVADANDRAGVGLQTGRLRSIADIREGAGFNRRIASSNWTRGYYRTVSGKRVWVPGFYR